jgi:hypothetical protein
MISFKAPALAILFAGMLAASVSAADTFAIPAASGHPWNNEARSNFIINDNAVQVSGATWRAWVTFLQLPSTATSVTVTKAFFPGDNSIVKIRLCSFNVAGGWVTCTAESNGTTQNIGTIAIPAGGTVFIQSTMRNGGWVSTFQVTY